MNTSNMSSPSLHPAGELGSGISREDYLDKVVSDVVSKLPQETDLEKTRKAYGLEISPTTIVLLQELERFNKLINRMRTSLLTLRKVCATYQPITVDLCVT